MVYPNNSIAAVMALEQQRTEDYLRSSSDKIYTCTGCGGEIYAGEDCLLCDSGEFCRPCVVSMTSEDILELLGYSFMPAD